MRGLTDEGPRAAWRSWVARKLGGHNPRALAMLAALGSRHPHNKHNKKHTVFTCLRVPPSAGPARASDARHSASCAGCHDGRSRPR